MEAICRTGELQQAAEACALSVSSASRQLKSLRAYFRDELFLRTGAGLAPTARMKELRPMIQHILAAVDRVVSENQVFAPKNASGIFRILSFDNGLLNYVVPVLPLLHAEAPALSIEFGAVSSPQQLVEELRNGSAELAILPTPPKRADLVCRDLSPQTYVLMMRSGHPLCGKDEITKEDLLKLTQVMPSKQTGRPWTKLFQCGMPSVLFPYFNTAPFLLLETDYVAWMPSETACRWMRLGGFVSMDPPEEFRFSFVPKLIWNSRSEGDELHQWVRSLVLSAIPLRETRG